MSLESSQRLALSRNISIPPTTRLPLPFLVLTRYGRTACAIIGLAELTAVGGTIAGEDARTKGGILTVRTCRVLESTVSI